MPESAVSKTIYNSIYHHGVDEKRRVQIPAKWRPADPEAEFTMVVWDQNQGGTCLRVLPPAEMLKLMERIEAMPSSPDKTAYKRHIGSNSTQVTVDKGGRICVPDDFAKQAGITDKATLVGVLTAFEIWSPDRHHNVKQADAVVAGPRAFSLLE